MVHKITNILFNLCCKISNPCLHLTLVTKSKQECTMHTLSRWPIVGWLYELESEGTFLEHGGLNSRGQIFEVSVVMVPNNDWHLTQRGIIGPYNFICETH